MDICLIFNFHTPIILNNYSFFDIGRESEYFDQQETKKVFLKNYDEIYGPLINTILDTASRKDSSFSLSFSGIFLELMAQHHEGMVKKIKRRIDAGKIEIVGGTYYHSLCSLFSDDLFSIEAKEHLKLIKELFGVSPTCMANTENIYSNNLAAKINSLKYKTTITPKINWYVGDSYPHQVFISAGDKKVSLLLSDYQIGINLLSAGSVMKLLKDDTLKNKLVVSQVEPERLVENKDWVKAFNQIKKRSNRLISVSQATTDHKSHSTYNIPQTLAQTNDGLDLSYFIENPLQKETIEKLRTISQKLNLKKDKHLAIDLRILSASENLLGMCTRLDHLEVTSPYDQYLSIMNILSDLELRLLQGK
ncbi:MAG: hypothetical protein JXQ96_03120 [Cyclobacteriaceae bacterium]